MADDVAGLRWEALDLVGQRPLGASALVMEIDHPVEATQLGDEIALRVGHPVQVAVVGHVHRRLELHVVPPPPRELLEEVLAAHRPDPDYGLTAAQRERRDLLSKLRGEEPLSDRELRRALVLALSE